MRKEPRWSIGKLAIRIASWLPAGLLALLTAHNTFARLPADPLYSGPVRLLMLIGIWIVYCLLLGWSKRLMPFLLMMCIPLAIALMNNWQFDLTKALLILISLAVTLALIRQLSLAMMTFGIIIAVVLSFGLSVVDQFEPAFLAREGALTWVLAMFVCWLCASAVLEIIVRLSQAGVQPEPA